MRQLYDSAYQSQQYLLQENSDDNTSKSNAVIFDKIYKMRTRVCQTMQLEDAIQRLSRAQSARSSALFKNEENRDTIVDASDRMSSSKLLDSMLRREEVYSMTYREYFHQKFTIIGCAPLLYPNGCRISIPCRQSSIVLPPGRYEDILLYLCHNIPLLSCIYFMPGSKLGAHGSRILYIGVYITIFLLYQFTSMLLKFFSLEKEIWLGTIINIFVITPLAVSVQLLLRYLYTCPFTESIEFKERYAGYESLILLLGRSAIIPLLLFMVGSLVIACLFSSGREIIMILVNFFLYIQLYGLLLAFIETLLLFVDNYYYSLELSFGVFTIEVICIGKLFKELIVAKGLTENVDFVCRSYNVFGIVKIQKILNRDDAVKAQLMAPVNVLDGTDESQQEGLELGSVGDNITTTRNPLCAAAAVDLSFASIYDGDSNDDVVGVVMPDFALFRKSVTTAESEDDESDNMLRLTYTAERASYECTLTFEEWKIKRKVLKSGTRKSFIDAFQKFEELEQEMKSESVKNAVHLGNITTKANPLRRK